MGTFLLTIGIKTLLPAKWEYLLSLGLMQTAVSPKSVSGLVVAITIFSSESYSLYC